MGYKEVFKKNTPDTSFTLTRNMVIDGSIMGDVSGRIEGVIMGDVSVQGKVIISHTGVIEGNVSGSDVIVQGLVKGNITATNYIQVEPQGQVWGSISSLSIFVDTQATIKGLIQKLTSLEEIKLLESSTSMRFSPSIPVNQDSKPPITSQQFVDEVVESEVLVPLIPIVETKPEVEMKPAKAPVKNDEKSDRWW